MKTKICDLLGIKYPIIEAPMGEKMGVRLTAAVSNAGGLGCIRQEPVPLYGRDAREVLRKELEQVKELTDKPIMVNVKFSPEDEALRKYGYGTREAFLEAILEERDRDSKLKKMIVAIYTSAGNALPFGKPIKEAGLKWIHKVSRLGQAKRAEEAGVDVIVAMGNAAGAHLGNARIDSHVLIPVIAETVRVPIIASGGYTDGKSLAVALMLGAEGIEMGTRLIATQEGDFHPDVKAAVVRARAEDTIIVPGRLSSARVYNNKFAQEHLRKAGGLAEEELKIANPKLKEKMSEEWHAAMRLQVEKGDMENAVLLIGQGVGRINDIPTVEELFQRIMKEALEAFQDLEKKVQRF